MSEIGIFARCDNTGLGIQSKEFFDNIPCDAIIVDVSRIGNTMPQNHQWYKDSKVIYYTNTRRFDPKDIKDFINNIDTLVCFETPYDFSLFPLCKSLNTKSVLQLNYEFLDWPSGYYPPDLFAAPSMWHYEEIPERKIFLPVPVNTKKFSPQKKEKTFLHIAGKPAIHDRNGTNVFLSALKYVKSDISVIIKCQRQIHIPKDIPSHINITYDFINRDNYWENYNGGVLVMPRKYGGLCLPCQEALAASMPVIMPNISPNNIWLPKEWLVPAAKTGSFLAKKRIDIYEADLVSLATKIDQFCNASFYNSASDLALQIANSISWDNLKDTYLKILTSFD